MVFLKFLKVKVQHFMKNFILIGNYLKYTFLWLTMLPVFISMCLVSCKEETNKTEAKNETAVEEKKQETLPQIIALSGEPEETTVNWTAFADFDSELRRLYEKEIDLMILLTELERKEVELENSQFPEKLDNPAIKSRMLVVRTYLGRAKAAIQENNPELMHKEKIAILKAYNALRIQITDVFKKNIAEEFLENDSL